MDDENNTNSSELQLQLRELELLRRENEMLRREKNSTTASEAGGSGITTNNGGAPSIDDRGGTSQPMHLGVREITGLIPDFYPGKPLCSSAKEWLDKIEKLKKIYQWDSRTTMLYASMQLRGAAKFWFDTQQEEIITWEQFKTLMRQSFPVIEDESSIHMKLMSRKRRADECIESYFYEMVALARKAKISDEAITQYIISGLVDKNLINVLTAADCNTLPQLLEKIKRYENIELQEKSRKIIEDRAKGHVTSIHHKHTPYDVHRSSNRSAKPSYEGRYNNVNRSAKPSYEGRYNNVIGKTCYICRKPGHLAFQCQEMNNRRARTQQYTSRPFTSEKLTHEGRHVRRVNANTPRRKDELYQEVVVDNTKILAFIDLGSDCTTMRESEAVENKWQFDKSNVSLYGFGGGYCRIVGKMIRQVRVGEVQAPTEVLIVIIVNDSVQETPMIIGRNGVHCG